MNLSRLDALCELAQRLADRLELERRQSVAELTAMERQQRGLQNYAAEYARSMIAPVDRSPQLLSLRHGFTGRLRNESAALRKQVQSRRLRLDDLMARAAKAQARCQALESLRRQRRQAQQQGIEQREQKLLDELASRRRATGRAAAQSVFPPDTRPDDSLDERADDQAENKPVHRSTVP